MWGPLLTTCHSFLSLPSLAQPSGSQPWMQTRMTCGESSWGGGVFQVPDAQVAEGEIVREENSI